MSGDVAPGERQMHDVLEKLHRFERFMVVVTRVIASFGAIGMLIVAGIILGDVSSRYFFGWTISGLNEAVSLLFAIAIAGCLPAGLANGVNLSVDIFRRQFGVVVARWLDAIGALVLLVFFGLLAWRALIYAESLEGAYSGILDWPTKPFIELVALMFVLAAFVQLVVAARFVAEATLGVETATHRHEHADGESLPAHPNAVGTTILALLGFLVVALGVLVTYGITDFSSLSIYTISNPTTAVTVAGLLLWLVLIGMVPISAAMGLIGLGGTVLLANSEPAYAAFSSEAIQFLTRSDTIVLPLFLLMGNFAAAAGMSEDIYRLAHVVFARMRGGLALATIGGCAGFGAVTGSSVATAATFGRIALPEMRQRGYAPSLATGCICAGGTLGALVPPSGALIVYALLTETSIGQLFVAAVIPAILAVLFYFATIYMIVRFSGSAAPAADIHDRAEIGRELRRSSGVLILFALVVGGLYLGIFTASESAAVGAFGAFLFAAARGKLKGAAFFRVMAETTSTTAMIYSLIIGALTFSFFVGLSNMPAEFVEWIRTFDISPLMLIIVIVIIFTLLGSVMDTFAIMFIALPVVVPLLIDFNFDLIWWGIVMLIVVETGQISPPFGLNLFIVKTVAPDLRLTTIYRGAIPFVIADIIKLALIIAIPAIALWLPSTAI